MTTAFVRSAAGTYGALLVDRARAATARRLDRGGDRLPHPERFVSLHRPNPLVRPGEDAA